MPKKSQKIKEPIIKVDKAQFVNTYLTEKFSMSKEFMDEFANAMMVHFVYPEVGPNLVVHWIVLFMKHFAFCIYHYTNLQNNTDFSLPSRPNYTPINVGDTQEFFFWRNEVPAKIPPRCFEAKDMNYTVRAEILQVWDQMEQYITATYLDRKTNKWRGLSGICVSEWGVTESPCLLEDWNHVNAENLITAPDTNTLGTSVRNVQDLFHFWIHQKIRFEGFAPFIQTSALILPTIPEELPPPAEVMYGNHKIEYFTIVDYREYRFLTYDVEGRIIGHGPMGTQTPETGFYPWVIIGDKDPQNKGQTFLYIFYDITLTKIEGVFYVAQINPMVDLNVNSAIPMGDKIHGTNVTLMARFDNWIKYKTYLPIAIQNSPEWFPGAFPKTEYCHMSFYGGHSFYIPDGYMIEANLTRLTKEAGYLSIHFVTDAMDLKIYFEPMINTVAYGKWTEYSEPNLIQLSAIIRDQWWALSAKFSDAIVITSKDALIAMGKRGTQLSALVPGMSSLQAIITTGGSIV